MQRGKLYRRSIAETPKLKQPQSTRICLASPNICDELESEPHTFDESQRPNSLSVVRELASQRRRFGYPRLGLLQARRCIRLSHKKLYRLYKEKNDCPCAGAAVASGLWAREHRWPFQSAIRS